MRGRLGPILVGLGGFLLVTAVLCRFWGYPKLAVAPIDQDSVTTLGATGATVFDTGTLEEHTTDLRSRRRRSATSTPPRRPATTSASGSPRPRPRTATARSSPAASTARRSTPTPARRSTAAASTPRTRGGHTAVEHEGLVFKFPFQTEKKSYDFWDSTLGKTIPIEYVGEEDVDGIRRTSSSRPSSPP